MAAHAGSQLFVPFRALGFVANHVPLAIQSQGTENVVATAVGNAFHVYNCAKLNLLFVGPVQEEEISFLTTHGDFIITACGKTVTSWKRGKKVDTFKSHGSNVHFLYSFGAHLITVDAESCVRVWTVKTAELYLEMEFDPATFKVTCLMHPSTYLNKILLCSYQGNMQLWNIKTNKLIYTFSGWGESITTVEQAPAVDVVAVGLQSGKVIVHNLKFDETAMSFTQDWGPVTSLTFRTDGNPIMATASTAGHIALWDLEARQLRSTIRDSHRGSVTGMKFLPSQPLLVTTGSDNSLKVWIFDQSDGSGRLWKSRSGHSAPPTKIRFYGSKGLDILSAGLDRTFRVISTIKDAQSCELSQGSLVKKSKNLGIKVEELKLPPVTDFASEEVRQSDWDNIVTCHQGHTEARTWHFQRKCMRTHKLKPQADKATACQAVAISSCGNFALTGSSAGHVDVFAIQSGLHRGSVGSPKAHDGPIRGLVLDSLNQQLVTASADCRLNSRKLLYTLPFDTPITQILLHRESSLLAVSCDDFLVHVVDIDMRRVVRTFTGHTSRVTDMTFSPDGRWLVTSSMDSSVRTWDLPAGRLLDCFLVESPITSLALSPVGEFLVTTHVDDLGIYLWSNRTLYNHVSLVPLPSNYQPITIQLPTTSTGDHEDTESEDDVTNGNDVTQEVDQEIQPFKSPDQLSDELVTLSLLPQSRWRNLTNLEIIKRRNKPKEPPKAPKAAPFFLPTQPGLVPKFLAVDEEMPENEGTQSKLIQMKKLQPRSAFVKQLTECASSNQYDSLMQFMQSIGPSAIDAEIRSLSPDLGGDLLLMKQFMEFLDSQLASRRDFEVTEAYMALFLKIHGSVVANNPELTAAATRLKDRHTQSWAQLQHLLNQSSCLVGYLKSAVI